MRIGIFSDTYTPQMSGIVVVIDIFRRNMTKLGHEVFIFAPKPLSFKETDPNIVRFNAIPGIFYDDYLTSMFFSPLEMRRIKKKNLDIVLILTPSQIGLLGVAAAKKFSIPLVSQYSTDLFEYVKLYPEVLPGIVALTGIASFSVKAKPREILHLVKSVRQRNRNSTTFSQSLVKNCVTLLHNNCDAVVSLSRKKQQQMIDWKTDTRLEMIPTGVDALPTTKNVGQLRAKLGIAEDDKVVIFAGRIAAEKNLDLLVDCFDRLVKLVPKARLLFVGDFEYRPILEEKASHLKNADRVIFTGRVLHEELGDYYAISDVFAFPSLTDTQGLVVHEAALAGLPLVLVDTEVSELLVPGQTGFYARNNPRNMAATLAKVLTLPKTEYQKLSAGAKAQAEKFSELEQTKKMITLFEELIAARQTSPNLSRSAK